MTRSQAWDRLEKERHIANQATTLSKQEHKKKKSLIKRFNKINTKSWEEETDMYPGIIEAIQQMLYDDEGIFVVDTHSKGAFHADISVAHHKDGCLPYSLLYFIKLKMPKYKLNTSENSGQIWTTSMPFMKSRLIGRSLLRSCPTSRNPGSISQTIPTTALLLISNAFLNLQMPLSMLTNYPKLITQAKFLSLIVG